MHSPLRPSSGCNRTRRWTSCGVPLSRDLSAAPPAYPNGEPQTRILPRPNMSGDLPGWGFVYPTRQADGPPERSGDIPVSQPVYRPNLLNREPFMAQFTHPRLILDGMAFEPGTAEGQPGTVLLPDGSWAYRWKDAPDAELNSGTDLVGSRWTSFRCRRLRFAWGGSVSVSPGDRLAGVHYFQTCDISQYQALTIRPRP